MTRIVFDTTALSHFSRAGRLDALKQITAREECILLAEARAELAGGVATYPSLGSVSAESWLQPAELNELKELAAFARYKGELGGGPERNNGEAAVLAWASVNGGIAIIDEEVGRNIGARRTPSARFVVVGNSEFQAQCARPRYSGAYRR